MFFGAASVSGFEEMGESDNLVFCVSWLESCVKVCVLVEDCKEPSEAGDGLQHVTHTHTHTHGVASKMRRYELQVFATYKNTVVHGQGPFRARVRRDTVACTVTIRT